MEANKVVPQPQADFQQPDQQAAAAQQQAFNTVLARMVNLSQTALKAESLEKAASTIVNKIHTLVKTERAVLVPLSGRKRIVAISGDLEPSEDNPFSQAVHEIRKRYRTVQEPTVISSEEVPAESDLPNAAKVLSSMGGTNILWLPIPDPAGDEPRYALWLERWNKRPWLPEEIRILSHALVFWGHALETRRKKKRGKVSTKRGLALALILFVLLLCVPVYSRVSAPVQIVPDHPHYVFAPFDGIVEELAVEPGEKVRAGDLIFRYDTRVLEQRLEEARQSVAVARAELARLEGAAYMDEEARARIPVQKLEVERKQSEVAFIQTQLDLSDVRSETEGVVVLDDPDALIGASLQTGQMVLRIADPAQTKLRIMVPVTDAGLVTDDAPVRVRLDSDPLRAIPATVERVGFDVTVSDERIPTVMVECVWDGNVAVTPGQRGTARIQGPKILLGLQIFRKPFMTVRTTLGL